MPPLFTNYGARYRTSKFLFSPSYMLTELLEPTDLAGPTPAIYWLDWTLVKLLSFPWALELRHALQPEAAYHLSFRTLQRIGWFYSKSVSDLLSYQIPFHPTHLYLVHSSLVSMPYKRKALYWLTFEIVAVLIVTVFSLLNELPSPIAAADLLTPANTIF